MNRLPQIWRALTTSKRCALLQAENDRLCETNLALEAEVEQLRREVRAMVNTLLSQAGVAPLPPIEERPKPPVNRIRHLSRHQQRRREEIKSLATELKLGEQIRTRVEGRLDA